MEISERERKVFSVLEIARSCWLFAFPRVLNVGMVCKDGHVDKGEIEDFLHGKKWFCNGNKIRDNKYFFCCCNQTFCSSNQTFC